MKNNYSQKKYTIALLAMLLLCCCVSLGAQNKKMNLLDTPRKIALQNDVSHLKIYSGIIVNLIPSDTNRMEIYGDRYGGIVATHKGNTLKIRMRLTELFHYNNAYIDLYYKAPIHSIKMHQGAVVEATRPLKNEKNVLKAHEGAQFSGTIQAEYLISKSRTGGMLQLQGKVKEHRLYVSAGGSCEAEDLITHSTQVRVFAGGYARIYSENNIDANVVMGGNIGIKGNPTTISARRTIAGEIYDANAFDHQHFYRNRSRGYRAYN